MTNQQKTAAALGLIGFGAAVLARAVRYRRRYDFAGKIVVITGGSRGLGLVLARHFAAQGAHLALIARDSAELQRAADQVRARHPSANVVTITADVRVRAEAIRAVDETVTRYGHIDVLVNNAGIIQVGPLEHMTIGDFEDAMNTHFWGPLFMVLAAVPHLRRQGGGRIVNIASIGGRIAVPHLVPYSASKFALVGLSDGLRTELARDNIWVTTVCPGLMRTGSPVNAMFKGRRAQEFAWFAISDSLPLSSIDVQRAARRILRACRFGDAELIITVQAKLVVLARTLAPQLMAEALAVMNGLLPRSAGANGDVARRGRDSSSPWAPSRLTTMTYRAAAENNE
jgi:NAD(P)-dependent dehydrogenase (short-subunit alcohol dehydrogenase family)